MRVVRILALVVLVLPLLLLAGAAIALDPMVHKAITTRTSRALGVPVTLNEADASLAGGIRLERLTVGNPEGYVDPQALRIDGISAEASPASLLTDVVKVESVSIVRPLLSIEFKGLKSNVAALIDHLPPSEKEKEPGKRFLIGRLRIEGATVRFTSDRLPGGTRTVGLPAIELRDIGTAEGAATLGQIATTVLRTLLREAVKHAPELPAELVRSLGEAAQERAEEFLEGARERIEDVPGLLEDRLKEELRKRKAE